MNRPPALALLAMFCLAGCAPPPSTAPAARVTLEVLSYGSIRLGRSSVVEADLAKAIADATSGLPPARVQILLRSDTSTPLARVKAILDSLQKAGYYRVILQSAPLESGSD